MIYVIANETCGVRALLSSDRNPKNVWEKYIEDLIGEPKPEPPLNANWKEKLKFVLDNENSISSWRNKRERIIQLLLEENGFWNEEELMVKILVNDFEDFISLKFEEI